MKFAKLSNPEKTTGSHSTFTIYQFYSALHHHCKRSETQSFIFLFITNKKNGLSAKEERKKKSTQTTAFNYTVYEQEEEQQNLKSYKKQRAKH